MERFRKLGILEFIVKAITEEKYEKPTEIQEKAIPPILDGKDVIGESATGSGKTFVFGSRIIQNSEKGKGIQALILTPTRELAEQVAKNLISLSRYKHLNIVKVYGGVSINPQIDGLRRADVVVGTPGRILDHINRRTIYLNNIKTLVLDEADVMFDMGFIDDVKKIIRICPVKRQTLLFSATISREVEYISREYMKDPVRVSAENQVDPTKLTQIYYNVPDPLKFSLLVHLLKNEKGGLVMVFCNTRRNTDFVTENLNRNGIEAMAIHGGLSQNKRSDVMQHFHTQKVYVLVCTDVAARGLDIKGVSHVYNYDIPKDPKQYIHRIGRTARAGKEGKAISILSSNDYMNFSKVQKICYRNITKEEMPYVERVQITKLQSRPDFRRGFGGRSRFGGSNSNFKRQRHNFR